VPLGVIALPRRSKTFRPASVGISYEIRFNPSTTRFACCGRSIVFWDLQRREKIATVHPFKHPSHVDWSPAGDYLAVKNTSGKLAVIDTHSFVVKELSGGSKSVEGCEVAFSTCGNYIISGTWDGLLTVTDVRSEGVIFSEQIGHSMITDLVWTTSRQLFAYVVSPKATSNVVSPDSDYVVIRKWPFWENSAHVLSHRPRDIHTLALDPTGKKLVLAVSNIGFKDHKLQVYDIENLRLESEHDCKLWASGKRIAWSPDGSLIANIESDAICFYEPNQLALLQRLKFEGVCFVEFSHCGEFLAVGNWGKGFVATPKVLLGEQGNDA
jgi:WD40 repeat protein